MSDMFRVKIPCDKGTHTVEIVHCSGTLNKATILNVIAYCSGFQFGDIVALEKAGGGYYRIIKKIESGNFFLYEAWGTSMTPEYFEALLKDMVDNELKDYSNKVHIENWSMTMKKNSQGPNHLGIAVVMELPILENMAKFINRRKLICPDLIRDSGDELGYRRHLKQLE